MYVQEPWLQNKPSEKDSFTGEYIKCHTIEINLKTRMFEWYTVIVNLGNPSQIF